MSVKKIVTPLSKVLPSVRTPVVLGAMAGASGGDLAGAVSSAGGFGFIGAGYLTPSNLRGEVTKAYSQLSVVQREVIDQHKRADFGIGILVWRLTEMNGGQKPTPETSTSSIKSEVTDFLTAIVEGRPRAIWLSFGDEIELIEWQRIIADLDAQINKDLAGNVDESIKWVVMIGREEELRTAVERCRCDVLVVQGCEAGGHGHSQSPPLSALLADVLRQLPTLKPNNDANRIPPVLGAGGLADGRSLASLLCAGCSGAVFGTRFVVTPESTYADVQKHALVAAKSSQTLRTFAFDDARGTLGWPTGTDGRGLRNKTVDEYEADLRGTSTSGSGSGTDKNGAKRRMERYSAAAKEQDTDRIVIWAGTGIGAINHITPARQVVHDITHEAVQALSVANGFVHS
ncbi:2-nitropropane dioxygenase [Testicularia cyperi]|uniref:2-nitropropane dioxygenase n=1 Tax=Testicularia cyperi TaxID=1882483 RepID=A0A317XNT3_9BASI|nr:2-nitropropane dioxygenase [Testicularia cyperi]